MTTSTPEQLEQILEAALMVAGQPLTVAQLQKLFADPYLPSTADLRAALESLTLRYEDRGIQLREGASGFHFQARVNFSPWLSKLWEERPPRYSRAFLETLAIIAYRQPVTRAEIEDIRGVSISGSIFKTLLEREWIRSVGFKDVPGKPAIYGTTKTFLDHFNLKSLRELPLLAETEKTPSLETPAPVQLAFNNGFPEPLSDTIEEALENENSTEEEARFEEEAAYTETEPSEEDCVANS